MPVLKTLNRDFFKKWSSEMAYVLGFFAADGYMIKNKRGAFFVDFYSNDRKLLEKIKKIIGSNHKITTREHESSGQSDSYRIQIGSKEWFSDLTKLGFIQNKSASIKFPNVPGKYLAHFVRGYFDGDGCVSLGRYWFKDRKNWKWQFSTNFTSGSKVFLECLWRALGPYVKGGCLIAKRHSNAYSLAFSTHDSVALSRLMYYNISSDAYLKRKYSVFQKTFKILNLGP